MEQQTAYLPCQQKLDPFHPQPGQTQKYIVQLEHTHGHSPAPAPPPPLSPFSAFIGPHILNNARDVSSHFLGNLFCSKQEDGRTGGGGGAGGWREGMMETDGQGSETAG